MSVEMVTYIDVGAIDSDSLATILIKKEEEENNNNNFQLK